MFGDEDAWPKVSELKIGTELRIYTTGAKQPIVGRLDTVKRESILIVTKKGQIAVPKNEIERIDRRLATAVRQVVLEARRVVGTPESTVSAAAADRSAPPRSTLAGIRIKPARGYETVYERAAARTQK